MVQAIQKKRGNKANFFELRALLREGTFIVSLALTTLVALALLSHSFADPGWSYSGDPGQIHNLGGRFGAWLSDFLITLFGYGAYLFPLLILLGGFSTFQAKEYQIEVFHWPLKGFGCILVLLATSSLLNLHLSYLNSSTKLAGGALGKTVSLLLTRYLNIQGTTIVLATLLLLGITFVSNLSWLRVVDWLGRQTLKSFPYLINLDKYLVFWHKKKTIPDLSLPPSTSDNKETEQPAKKTEPTLNTPPPSHGEGGDSAFWTSRQGRAQKIVKSPVWIEHKKTVKEAPIHKLSKDLPSLSLLDPPEKKASNQNDVSLEALGQQVELKLKDFGIDAHVVAIYPGPVVTRFELQLAPGIKANKVTNLSRDLARALMVVSVRVAEVIPGKSVIGLELPNKTREVVRLREILESTEYQTSKTALTLALGKDIAGFPFVVDLTRMPHLLVAGTTGSGKSVGLNAMLLNLLYKWTPEQVRMILIDPKMLELSIYEGIPHLLTPVVTDMRDAANALRWCVAEMDRRYRLMTTLGVRNISGYNEQIKQQRVRTQTEQNLLPFIVVVIDELADMMMVVGKKVDLLIARIAQKARAAGIHLIVATQRPSVDVITGLIKANIPTRIAYQVSSRIDSRTILDQQGAEQLLGHGDMLYLAPGAGIPTRVHGAFVADHEVHKVVEALKQQGEPQYQEDVLAYSIPDISESGTVFSSPDEFGGESDDLYDQAVRIVTETRRASVSLIQRRLKIGYNRAARIVEDMEKAGVVGQMQTNGFREVLAPPPVVK